MKLTRKEMIEVSQMQRDNPCESVFTIQRKDGSVITVNMLENDATRRPSV